MPVISHSTIALDLEDFRRLGVRPHECRLAVIRRAAMQSAKSLAERQLTSPSEQVGLQLSRVTTSAYRLLDPRRRRDVTQRVHVGRILPNALHWAGQTSFQSGLATTSGAAPFGHESLSDAELFELFQLDTSSRSQEDGESWETSRGDDDLLFDAAPPNRRRGRFRSRFRLPWVLLSTVGLAIGAVLGLATLRARQNELRLRRIDDSPSSQEALPNHRNSIDSDDVVEAPAAARLESKLRVPEKISPELSFAPNTKSIAPQPEHELLEDVPFAMTRDTLDATDPAMISAGSALPLQVEPAGRIGAPMLSSHEASQKADGFLSDPFTAHALSEAPPAREDIAKTELNPAMPVDADRSDDALASPPRPAETRHAIPDEASVRAARTQVMLLVPQLAHTVAIKEVALRIAEIEAVSRDFSVGTADDWTARLFIAELAWLIEDDSQVSRRLQSLVEHYDTPLEYPLTESFVAACESARLPETHQHLLTCGLRLADQLLTGESFAQCRRVIEAIGPSAELLELESSLGYVEQYSQAVDQMERLAESSKRLIDDAGEAIGNSRDLGILGRYYCLMLRRWDVGLPWLTDASDSRIASIARQEVELGGAGSAEELIALSQRWLAAADRSSGHAADSMRLHAIDVLRGAPAETSRLKKLEMEELIDQAEQVLPPFLHSASPSPEAPGTSDDARTPSAGESKVEAKNGLSGRILVDQQDIGVQLNYELDVAFTQTMLDTVAERLSRTLAGVSIEMVGQFELDGPATVLVSIAKSQQGTSQKVELDGVVLEMDPLDGAAKILLAPGKHEITWTIEGERFSGVFLSLHDAATGRRVRVVQPADARPPAALTVAMVRAAR